MSPAPAPLLSGEPPAPPFPSLSALRSVHSDLLKRQATSGNTADFLAAVEDFLQRGQETGALLDAPEDRWSAQSALDYWASALYRFGRREVDPVLVEFDPSLAPELDDALCPYVGLEAFQETQHEMFFGRARLINEMLSCLEKNRLLAVLGSSGSGKSSVVLGGLLPALKSGAISGSEDWRCLPSLVPGSEPLKSLARALPGKVDPAKLEKNPEHLARLLAGDPPAVLVIDQFEEVFTLCEDSRVRQAFLDSLLGLLRTPEPQHFVILTMRSDYEAFVARHPDLQTFFEKGQLRMTSLTAAELREAIERPAESVGLKFEDGVVQALLEDILGEPAGLPLLQFTLLKLWESRDHNRVTWASYRRLGGGRLALARSADAFYDSLIPEEQVTARRILLRIVRPGSGLEILSNRIRKESLYQSSEDPGRIDRVLNKLVQARLVRFTKGETDADDQVEVAHEALVRNWPRLVEWLEEDRAEITTRRRWESRAAEWVQLGRGQGGLLDEVQLAEAERWLESPEAVELGYDEQLAALVRASRQAVDEAVKKKRSRTLLRWGALIGMALAVYVAGWAALVGKMKQADLVRSAQKQVAALEAEKHKLAEEKAAFEQHIEDLKTDLRKLRGQAVLDRKSAEQQTKQAEQQMKHAKVKAAEAAQVVLQARLDTEKAQGEARTAILKASNENKAAEEISAYASWLLDDAMKKQEMVQAQIAENEAKLADSERKLKRAIEHTTQLETEIADGGRDRGDAIPSLFTSRRENWVAQKIELRRFRKSYRPVHIGVSTSAAAEKSLPGTICCLVRDSSGQEYLLSRSSVFSGPTGGLIVQPSRRDGGTDEKRYGVALIVRSGPNRNRSGALARLLNGIEVDPSIPSLGSIRGIQEAEVGAPVWLVGAGSGVKKGTIVRIEEDGTIVTDIIPSPGDSGAPILTPAHRIIGMLWGWSERANESYVSPIRQVLEELGVELVVE